MKSHKGQSWKGEPKSQWKLQSPAENLVGADEAKKGKVRFQGKVQNH